MEPGIINKHFPRLTSVQLNQFGQLGPLYLEWNGKINVISRKDIENLYERHVLHSLAIAGIIQFKPGTKILDAGTGGGFPGVPLAIMFPESDFHLVDSTAKKLTVVNNIATEIGLKNISTEHGRLEDHHGHYDFVVSRAVASLPEFISLVSQLISHKNNNAIPNGILYLKGGDFDDELESISRDYHIFKLGDFFEEEFFKTKKLIHIY